VGHCPVDVAAALFVVDGQSPKPLLPAAGTAGLLAIAETLQSFKPVLFPLLFCCHV
jgi:hypothetical protein